MPQAEGLCRLRAAQAVRRGAAGPGPAGPGPGHAGPASLRLSRYFKFQVAGALMMSDSSGSESRYSQGPSGGRSQPRGLPVSAAAAAAALLPVP